MENDMKVLHIIDSLGLGGAQTVVKGVFETQKHNKNIFLYALRKKEITTKIYHANVCISPSTFKYSLRPLKQLKDVIRENNIQILHCHLFRSQLFGWILKKFYFPNIKLIIHEHGQIFQNNFYYNNFIRIAETETNLFLAVSRATRRELIKNAKIQEKKIKVFYNFVDLEKFNKKNITLDIKKEKKKLGIKKDEFVVGFAGRLAKVKGCEYLIRSLPYLDFKYKCLIAGDGELRKELEVLTKELKVEDKVIFLGYQENVLKTYSLLDVLVIPSLRESFGLITIEAQALGIPVISSNVPALNEIIINRENGLLFKVKNSKGLALKIKEIKENSKMRDSLTKNSLENLERYSLKEYTEKINIKYKKILK
jgi:L-malate glycosyltransferase